MNKAHTKSDEYVITLDRETARLLAEQAEHAGFVDDLDYLSFLVTHVITSEQGLIGDTHRTQ